MRWSVILSALALSLAATVAEAGELLFGQARVGDDVAAVAAAAPDAKTPAEPDGLNGAELGLEQPGVFHLGATWRVRYFFLDGKLDAVQLTRNPAAGRREDDIRQGELWLKGLAVIHGGDWSCKQALDPATTTYLDCDIVGSRIDVGYSYMMFGEPFEVMVFRGKRPLN